MNSNLKICVYAISKNEVQFIDRWLDSMSEADYVVVLDTGSTDGTFEKLQTDDRIYKVEQKIIDPWRFDTARNESMKLIPKDSDICVVADLDQVFRPGYGQELRKLFNEGYEQIHGDVIYYDADGKEKTRILSNQVHSNSPDFHWVRPVHEYITCDRNVRSFVSSNFIIEHHPDTSKSRDNYLNLVEKEFKENSNDVKCAIYYSVELSNHGRYDEALEVLLQADKESNSDEEQLKYLLKFNLSTMHNQKGEYENALMYAYEALNFRFKTRRLYVLIADIYHNMNSKKLEIQNLLKALTIREQINGYIEESSYFKGVIEDRLALIYYQLADYKNAIYYNSLALRYNKEDERLLSNMQFYLEAFKGENSND